MTERKVLESYTRDVGRGVVRIDYDTMDELNISTGDVIEISGKRKTVAKALPLYPTDEEKQIIRIDGLGRNNSGVVIGNSLTIKKIKAVAADKVVVKPLEAIPPIDERYLADALESVPVITGDNLMVPYFGGRLTFEVIETVPNAPVLVTQKTIFTILDGSKIGDFIIYPARRKVEKELCKCMHSNESHDKKCNICLCTKYDRSVMNDELDEKIERAKKDARPMANVTGGSKK